MPSQVRRNPDSGVATAVTSLIQHQNFKRMLIFAVRSLNDFCNPASNILWKENALDAMRRSAIGYIKSGIANYGDDEDLTKCSCRVLWAMTEACKDELNASELKLLSDGAIDETMVSVINAGGNDFEVLEKCLDTLKNLNIVEIAFDSSAVAPGLVTFLSQPKLPLTTATRIIRILAITCNTERGAASVAQGGGINLPLQYCLSHAVMDEVSLQVLEASFDCAAALGKYNHWDTDSLDLCVKLLEKYRSKKGVYTKGCTALSTMVKVEKLKSSLQNLNKCAPNSKEHEEALVMLGCMSYISSYADEIVKAGGIPVLIGLINSSLSQLETSDKFFQVIVGASRMIGRICMTSSNLSSVAEAGGLATLCTAITYCTANPECLGSICQALVPFVEKESYAAEVESYQTFATILPILYEGVENNEIAQASMELVATASQHSALKPHLIENLAVEICSTCCQYHTDDAVYQGNAINALNQLVSTLSGIDSVYEYGGLNGITMSLLANTQDAKLALAGVQLLEKFCTVPDPNGYMIDENLVNAVLSAMLDNEKNPDMLKSGLACLSIIATDEDCKKHTSNFESLFANTKNAEDGTIQQRLAAISGLSRLSHLKNTFVVTNTEKKILDGISYWIKAKRFDAQCELIRKGFQTLKTVVSNISEDIGPTIDAIAELASLSQLRRLVELEEPDENALVYSTSCIRDLCIIGPISAEAIELSVESIFKVMKRYPESRRAQITCIEALNHLLNLNSTIALNALINSGGIKTVTSYLLKVPVYLDAQIAGFTLLSHCSRIDKSSVEVMQKCNCLKSLQVAMRQHSKSRELKTACSPLFALLMPTDALESAIREKIKECHEGMDTATPLLVHESLIGLKDLLVSPEGAKISARCDIGIEVKKIYDWAIEERKLFDKDTTAEIYGQDLYEATMAELMQVCANAGQARSALVQFTKNELTPAAMNCLDISCERYSNYTADLANNSLETLRLLMKHDKFNAENAFDHGLLTSLRRVLEAHPDNSTVLVNTAACLAAMATTPARITLLISQPDFDDIITKLIKIIENPANLDVQTAALTALADLLQTKDTALVNRVAGANAIPVLFSALENYSENEKIAELTSKSLAIIGSFVDIRAMYVENLHYPVKILSTALAHNKQILTTCIPLLDATNNIITSGDRVVVKEYGGVERVADVMMTHENEEVQRLGGEIMAKMGADDQIKALMIQIIQEVEQAGEGMIRKVDLLCAKLAMYLPAPFFDPADALQYTEACLGALCTCSAAAPTDQRLQINIATVSRRLCEKSFDNHEDPYGAWAVTSTGLIGQLATLMDAMDISKNKKLLTAFYKSAEACAVNPYCIQYMLDLLPSILSHTMNYLEAQKQDPEVVERILAFLDAIMANPGAATQVMAADPKLDETIAKLLKIHKTDDSFVYGAHIFAHMGLHSASGSFSIPNSLKTGVTIKEMQASCFSNPTAPRLIAYINMLNALASSGVMNDVLLKEGFLNAVTKEVTMIIGQHGLSYEDNKAVSMAICSLMATLSSIPGAVASCNGFELVLNLLEELPDDEDATLANLEAMKAFVNDESLIGKVARNYVPSFLLTCSNLLSSSGACCDAYANLLDALTAHEGIGRQLITLPEVLDSLALLEQVGDAYGDAFGSALKEKASKIRQAMEDDQPKEKTCKDVYNYFKSLVDAEEPIDVNGANLVRDDFDFLFSQMTMYSRETLTAKSSLGSDCIWGFKAFELGACESSNLSHLKGADYAVLHNSFFKGSSDHTIITAMFASLVSFCKVPGGAETLVKTPGVVKHSAESIQSIVSHKTFTAAEKEEHLNGRLVAIDKLALSRNVFNNTNIMSALVGCWDLFDKGECTISLLRHTFRAMRRVVSDAHVEVLMRENVIDRLVDIINNLESDASIMPDVLFLLGSLAIIPEVKTMVGDLKGVEACCDLLRRTYVDPTKSSITTNSCLALANICIGHKKNSDIFDKLKGPNLNVTVLEECGKTFDVINAASVLLCNLLYKNEGMKKTYGSNNAAASLVKALRQYDGSCDKVAVRCLESLFKAISNMSLYTKNVVQFLEAEIEISYATWLNNLMPDFPDVALETGLRTLANLVMENEETNMRKFGVCLLPLLKIFGQDREDTKVMILLFEVASSLCRLKANAKAFSENGGINLTVDIIHKFDYDVNLLTLGVYLLGVQSSFPESLPQLLEQDIFGIYIGCFDLDFEGNEVTDLIIGGLRCSRRLIKSYDLAYAFCESGGVASLCNVICKAISQPLVMLEALRTLCGVFHYMDPTISGQPVESPEEGYGWYLVGMDETMVDAICSAICSCALVENHRKQTRLQKMLIGLCAKFVSEGAGADSVLSSDFEQCAISFMQNFPTEFGVTQMICVVVNNIALTSGDLGEAMRTKALASAIKSAVGKLPDKKPEDKELKTLLKKTTDAMNSQNDPFDAFSGTLTKLNLALTEWNIDPYPNGVQDLPSAIKETLRKGGKLKAYIGDKDAEDLNWRSSQDLSFLEWCYGNSDEYTLRVSIGRIRNIGKGLCHPALVKANQKESRKVTAKICCCVFGPITEDFPDGVELPLRLKTQKERDALVELLVQWRDAASYNI